MITVKMDDKLLREALNVLSQRMKNTRPLMVAIGAELQSQTDQNLKTGMGADGSPFAPWSEDWIEKRKKMGKYPGQILLLRGNLAKSISRKVTNDSVVIGTNVKYARIHQLGGQAGRGHKSEMPARPYLPFVGNHLQHGVQKSLLQIALNYLQKPLR